MKLIRCGFDFRHQQSFVTRRPNGSGDYVLILVRSPAYFLLNGRRVTTQGNAAILYRKGSPQIYGGNGAPFVNDWIHFDASPEEIADMESLGLSFDVLLPLPNISRLSDSVREICRECHSSSRHSEEASLLLFRLLLLRFSELLEPSESANHTYLYRRFSAIREEILLFPQKDWNVEELARSLSFSLSYFQHRYKEFFGTSVKKDVITGRMEYAKQLLASTDDCIYTVAALCGYDSEVHFMRVFKAYTGSTPSAFRRNAL